MRRCPLYAVSGTALRYAPRPAPVLVLRTCYAMSGADFGYAPARLADAFKEDARRQVASYGYRPTRLLCHVRY
eukprot:2736770-Rhodomonas_salina.1